MGFKQIGEDIGALVEQKNAAYGDSFAKSGLNGMVVASFVKTKKKGAKK